MNNNIKERIVLSAFAADAFSLGVHWIYDTRKLKNIAPIEDLMKPGEKSFHAGKKKGEFTHYGDQMLVLLESVSHLKKFDPQDFSNRWRDLFKKYNGYVDGATKSTLENLKKGKSVSEAGSNSNDLAGASRFAPIFLVHGDDEEALCKAAELQTQLTHADENTVAAAGFMARTAFRVSNGKKPVEAVKEVVKEHFEMTPLEMWVEEGLKTASQDTVSVIEKFGQSCHLPEGIPGVIHLIAKYEDNLAEALKQNVLAGGDSSARGMAVAVILGANISTKGVKREWIDGILKIDEIKKLIEKAIT